MKLTLARLKRMNACYAAREAFIEEFGREAEVSAVVAALHRRNATDWEAWLLSQDDPTLVKALLDNGADVHACNDEALRFAAEDGSLDVVKLLVKAGADVHAYEDEALCFAANNGHLDVVRLLVKAGADVHTGGNEALRVAANYGDLDTVKLLVKAGADVHACQDEALRYAADNGHTAVVDFLRSKMTEQKRSRFQVKKGGNHGQKKVRREATPF